MAHLVLPSVMGSLLAIMLAVLAFVMFLFYKKRKESQKSFHEILEPMSRARPGSKKMKEPKISTAQVKQLPVMRDTQFWVPEIYSSIVQPASPPRKVSRMQSTLDREIYSRTQDVSYLEAAETEVFETDSAGRRRSSSASKYGHPKSRRIASEDYRGMLNFSLQYKYDKALLLIVIVKAEALPARKNGDSVDPFVDILIRPYYKRRMHSEVHQKTDNPIFNQCFEFEVPPYEVRQQQVQFTVLDFSQQLNHTTIGVVTYDLATLDQDAFKAGKEFVLWKKIDKVTEAKIRKNAPLVQYPMEMDLDKSSMLLMVSLNYNNAGERLSVTINKGRNLPLADKKGKLDHHYVVVALRREDKTLKKQRTSVIKHDTNPVFNKTLVFEVSRNIIDTCSVLIKVRHHSDMGRDRTLALLSLGYECQGCEAEHWTDMLETRELVTRWHRLVAMESSLGGLDTGE